MNLKYQNVLWMLLLLVLFTFAAAPAAADEAAYQGEYTAEQTGPREFAVTFHAWTDEAVGEEARPCTVMLLIDVSNDSMFLPEIPESSVVYKAGSSTKSMDKDTVFYTASAGAYQEVRLFENKWCTVAYQDGKPAAGSKVVGTRTKDGLKDSFLFDVYLPETCETRLAGIKESTIKLIEETAVLSPESKIGLIFFGDSLSVTEPVSLTDGNVKTLTEAVNGCDALVSGSAQNVAALEEAAKLLEAENEDDGRCIVNISVGLAVDNEEENAISAAKKTAQDIRMAGIKIYAAGLYEGTSIETQGQDFLVEISSSGFDRPLGPAGLSDTFAEFREDFLAGSRVTVAAVLDPRFSLGNAQRALLEEDDVSVEIRDDGVTVIEWQAGMPRTREMPWMATVQLSVKLDFPGGNDIPVCTEGSGIYKTGAQVYSFRHQTVNIGMDMEMYDLETTVFLGQKVPAQLGSSDLQSRMIKNSDPNWYGKGETGAFTYLWQEKDGGKVGQKEQLQEVTPTKTQTYILTMTYKPKTDGRSSVGEAVGEMQNSAEYLVSVQSGTVRVKMVLPATDIEDAAGDFYILKLESDDGVQYRTMSLKNRSEDGEGLCLETAFTGLPYGKYTVSRIYAYVSGFGVFYDVITEEECMVGYQQDSDKIDVEASDITVVTKPGRTGQKHNDAYAQTATRTYSIDFSKEGETNS